jgi:hypothetical protein
MRFLSGTGLEALMRLAILSLTLAVFGLGFANATTLRFSALTSTGETVAFTLDTTVPNTYSPTLYPPPTLPLCACGVYLDAVQDLNFEGTHIARSDIVTMPGMTGDGRPITIMDVGPLFNTESLSLFLIFLDPTLVSPLSSDASAYERSLEPFQSVLFPAIPPPRTGVDPLLTLTVSEVPEPSYGVFIGVIAVCTIALRRSRVWSNHIGFPPMSR